MPWHNANRRGTEVPGCVSATLMQAYGVVLVAIAVLKSPSHEEHANMRLYAIDSLSS
jgi:hypothetical protein